VGYNRAAAQEAAAAQAEAAAAAAAQAEAAAQAAAQAADIIRRRGNRGRGGIIMNIEDRRGQIARAERMLEEAARAAEQEAAARAAEQEEAARMQEEAARMQEAAAAQEEAARMQTAAAAQEEAALLAPEQTVRRRVLAHMAYMDSINARRPPPPPPPPPRQMDPQDYYNVLPTARNFPENHDYYPGLTREQINELTGRMGGEKKRKYTSVLRKKYQQRRRRRSSTKKYKNKKN